MFKKTSHADAVPWEQIAAELNAEAGLSQPTQMTALNLRMVGPANDNMSLRATDAFGKSDSDLTTGCRAQDGATESWGNVFQALEQEMAANGIALSK